MSNCIRSGRGNKTCGDIDIVLTRPTDDGNTHRGGINVDNEGLVAESATFCRCHPSSSQGTASTWRYHG